MAADGRGIQSVEIGMRLLECIAQAEHPQTLTEIATTAGMSPSKAHFYLKSFARTGYVSQAVAGGRYRLGPASIRIGIAALSQVDVLELARQASFELRDSLGETVFLSVWGSHGPTIVSRVQGFGWSPLELRVGSVLPPQSATGRAFLAWYPERARAEALASVTPASDGAIDFEQVRRDGVAFGNAMVASGSGFIGLAAPVFDHADGVAGVLTIIGDVRTFDMRIDGPNVQALLATSRRISSELRFPERTHARALP